MTCKILFPIETVVRELPYKLVLAGLFAQRGFECYIGEKGAIRRLSAMLRPFIYFDKGYHSGISENIYEAMINNGGLIVNLDEEGGVDYEDSSTILSRYPEKLFKICDCVFLWGRYQYSFLQSNGANIDENKVVISGHPRFQLLKTAYQGLYNDEVTRIQKEFGDYILINTNMGFGNNIRGDEFVLMNYGGRVKQLDQVMKYDKIKTSEFIALAKALTDRLNCKIIIRPHPEERSDTYESALKDYPNVKTIYKGSVIPWILGANLMIHADCTTGIEAFMLHKKSISYLPLVKEITHTFLPVALSYAFQEEDKVIEFISSRDYLSTSADSLSDSLLNEYFAFDMDSFNIIVEKIVDLSSQFDESISSNLTMSSVLKEKIKDALRFAYDGISQDRHRALAKNKLEGFDFPSVHTLFECVRTAYCLDNEIKIKKLQNFLYQIERK